MGRVVEQKIAHIKKEQNMNTDCLLFLLFISGACKRDRGRDKRTFEQEQMHPCMQSIASIRIVYMSRGYILIDIFRLHFASDTALRHRR